MTGVQTCALPICKVGPEVKEWWGFRKAGVLQTEAFHDEIEKTHIGYIHGWLRKRGWIHYPYMDQAGETAP